MKQTKKTAKTQGVDVEKLLNARAISNQAIQGALNKLEEQKKQAEEARIIQSIATIQKNTEDAVLSLRNARMREKAAKTYLQTIANAEQEFYKTADKETYDAVIGTAIAKYGREVRGY